MFIHGDLSYKIVGAAMEVHNLLGPGFLEAVYQSALAHELNLRNIHFEQEKQLPVYYKDILIGDYYADFVVEDKIILEIKALTQLHPKHKSQALHYLTATGFRLAILINFGAPSLEYERVINNTKK